MTQQKTEPVEVRLAVALRELEVTRGMLNIAVGDLARISLEAEATAAELARARKAQPALVPDPREAPDASG